MHVVVTFPVVVAAVATSLFCLQNSCIGLLHIVWKVLYRTPPTASDWGLFFEAGLN